MLSIKWNDEKMNLGIDLIDKQHKELLNLINNIMYSIENNNQIEDIEKIVEKVLDYAKYHFRTEENLFTKYNLDTDDINRHKKEHKDFVDKAKNIYSDLNNDKSIKNNYGIEILTDLYNYLTRWLVHHIINEDKKIFKIKENLHD